MAARLKKINLMNPQYLTSIDEINQYLLITLTKNDIPARCPNNEEALTAFFSDKQEYQNLFPRMPKNLSLLAFKPLSPLYSESIKIKLQLGASLEDKDCEKALSTSEDQSEAQIEALLKTQAEEITDFSIPKTTREESEQSDKDYFNMLRDNLIEIKKRIKKAEKIQERLSDTIAINNILSPSKNNELKPIVDNLASKIKELEAILKAHEPALVAYELKQADLAIRAFIYLYISHLEAIGNRCTYTVSIEPPTLPESAKSLATSTEYASLKKIIDDYSSYTNKQHHLTVFKSINLNPITLTFLAIISFSALACSYVGRLFYYTAGGGFLKGLAHGKTLFSEYDFMPTCIPRTRINKGIFSVGAIFGLLLGLSLSLALSPLLFIALLILLPFKSFLINKYNSMCLSLKNALLEETTKQGEQLARPTHANSFLATYKTLLLAHNKLSETNEPIDKKVTLDDIPIDLITDSMGWDLWCFADLGFFSRGLMAQTFAKVTERICKFTNTAPTLPVEVKKITDRIEEEKVSQAPNPP